MPKKILTTFALVLFIGQASSAGAQLPPGVYAGERDFKQAAAGRYGVDPDHTAVIAKVSHIGYALSVFRFDKVAGALTWDPTAPDKTTLKVSVDTASISTPVAGFAAELVGSGYLNSPAFPKATFVSTNFREIDPTHGKVDGQFTLMGKTVPLTFDAELMGAGKGFGHPRIGVEATSKIDPRAFGLSPLLGTSILLVVDAEFAEGS